MEEVTTITDTLEDRQAAFQKWVSKVRDPATAKSEGRREIATSNDSASAAYEVAQLPDATWAIRMGCEFQCGNYHGRSIPWTRFSTRQDCIDFFLKMARHHFAKADHDASDRQKSTQVEMKALLEDGLFGFLEPEPSASTEAASLPQCDHQAGNHRGNTNPL